MAIDASIYRAFAPPQRSAVQYAGEFDELQDRRANQRDLMANNALARTFNTAKLEDFQAQRQRANALAALQQSLAGKPDEEVLAGLRGAGQFDAAGAFEKGILERDETRAKIGREKAATTKEAAQAEKAFGEAQADALKRYRGALDYIDSPAGAQRWLQAQYADPSIPQDPAGFAEWRQRAAMGMEGWLKQRLEENKAAETGRHNVATEGLTKRGQDVSASTTIRGQNLTDARGREANDIKRQLVMQEKGLKVQELQDKAAERQRARDAGVASIANQIAVIDKALQHPGRKTATGLSGTVDPRNYIPGTDATDFRVVRDQIGGAAFLQAFESLKGGGQITEVEGRKATEAIARLNTTQSDKEFEQSLKDLRQVMQIGYKRLAGREHGGSSASGGGDVGVVNFSDLK